MDRRLTAWGFTGDHRNNLVQCKAINELQAKVGAWRKLPRLTYKTSIGIVGKAIAPRQNTRGAQAFKPLLLALPCHLALTKAHADRTMKVGSALLKATSPGLNAVPRIWQGPVGKVKPLLSVTNPLLNASS